MIREGKELSGLHPQIVVKIPNDPGGHYGDQALQRSRNPHKLYTNFLSRSGHLAAKAGATMYHRLSEGSMTFQLTGWN
jgi:hypothetical protein